MITVKFQWPTRGPLLTITSDDPGDTGVLPAFVAPAATGVQLLKDIAAGTRTPMAAAPAAPGLFAAAAPYVLPLICAGDSPKKEPEAPLPQRPVEWQQQRFAERPGHADRYRQMIERDRERMTETMMPERYHGDRTKTGDAPVVMPEDAPPAIALPATPVPTVEDSVWEVARPAALPYFGRFGRAPESAHESDTSIPHGSAGIGRDLMHDAFSEGVMDFLIPAIPGHILERSLPMPIQMSARDKDLFPEDTIDTTLTLPSRGAFQKLVRGGQVTTPSWTLTRLGKQAGYLVTKQGEKGFVLDMSASYPGESMLYVPRRLARQVASRLSVIQINLPTSEGMLTYVVAPIGQDNPVPIVSELEVTLYGPRPLAVHMPWTEAYLRHSPADYNPLTDSRFRALAPADWAVHSRLTAEQSRRAADALTSLWQGGRWPSGPEDDTHQFMLPLLAEALRDPKVADDVKTIVVSILVNEGDLAFRYLTSMMAPEYKPRPDDALRLDDHFREELELTAWAMYRFFPSLHDTQSLFPRYRPVNQ